MNDKGGRPTLDEKVYKIRYKDKGTSKTMYYSDKEMAWSKARELHKAHKLKFFGEYTLTNKLTRTKAEEDGQRQDS